MFRVVLFFFALTFSINSFAETCEGFNACAALYSSLTGEKLSIDKNISDEMTLAYNDANLTKKNAKTEFKSFLNKNAVQLMNKNQVVAMRDKEFLTSPIFVVGPQNMPRLFNKDALVTFIYHYSKSPAALVNASVRAHLTKKKMKSRNNIVEYKDSKIISVSDTGEAATKIMNEIFKEDK